MSVSDDPNASGDRLAINPRVATLFSLAAVLLLAAAGMAYSLLKGAGPTPAEIAGDPLLTKGYEVYQSRCVSCHGTKGKGDGPIAKGLTGGPPPGDLSDDRWKHGDSPEQVLVVITEGVPGTNMSGFGKYRILDADEIKAVSAYVFRLAGREVPGVYRKN